MRRALIRFFLPLFFILVPLLAAGLIAVVIPPRAREFYLDHLSPMDFLILGLGAGLFALQLVLGWRAMCWRSTTFDERPDRWLSSLAQAAEWFPLLGLLGTVAGILQTFSAFKGQVSAPDIIAQFAPAITATGSGLFAALLNILPTWVVLLGREIILTLAENEQAD